MTVRVWVAGAVALLTAAGLASPVQAASRRGPDLFGDADYEVAFSPNGDGRRDTARWRFALSAPADVTVTVRRGPGPNGVVRRLWLGQLPRGAHAVRWDGIDGDGRAVTDGEYDLHLMAVTGEGRDFVHSLAVIDTVNRGRVTTSRPVVHPQATAVHDLLQVAFLEKGWSVAYLESGDFQARTALRILDRRGRIVFRRVVRDSSTPAFDWDARRADGAALRRGAYVARVRAVDEAGNVVRRSARLRVSRDQLVEEVWTSTFAAAEATTYPYEEYPHLCNGCGSHCLADPSQRFVGGLTYGQCADCSYCYGTAGNYTTDVPFDPAPVDSFRVTATGGPTTPGSPDVAGLTVGESTWVPTPSGDASTTSPWIRVDLVHKPYLPSLARPVVWEFGTIDSQATYDVATFTVEYRRYVPVS